MVAQKLRNELTNVKNQLDIKLLGIQKLKVLTFVINFRTGVPALETGKVLATLRLSFPIYPYPAPECPRFYIQAGCMNHM